VTSQEVCTAVFRWVYTVDNIQQPVYSSSAWFSVAYHVNVREIQ